MSLYGYNVTRYALFLCAAPATGKTLATPRANWTKKAVTKLLLLLVKIVDIFLQVLKTVGSFRHLA